MSERSFVKKENEIIRKYALMLRQLRSVTAEIYAKYEQDGKLTYETMAKYDRLKKFENEIRKQLMTFDRSLRSEINRLLNDEYQDSYLRTAYQIEKESRAKLAYSAVKPEVIKNAIQNNFTGLTLNERLERRRNDLIIKMRETITKGLHEGRTFKQMSDSIKESLEGDAVKARRIVRTESKRVREEASNESARHAHEKGVIMQKVWNTVEDERTRDRHNKMNGVSVPVDEDFELPSGAKGKNPGSIQGPDSASENINCRCFTTFEVVRVEAKQHDELKDITYSKWLETRAN